MAMYRSDDLIMTDIHAQMSAVDAQIEELIRMADESDWLVEYTEIRDSAGHYLITPLLQTKSQLLLAEVMLKKGS